MRLRTLKNFIQILFFHVFLSAPFLDLTIPMLCHHVKKPPFWTP